MAEVVSCEVDAELTADKFGVNVEVAFELSFDQIEVTRDEEFELRIGLFAYDWQGDPQPASRPRSGPQWGVVARPLVSFDFERDSNRLSFWEAAAVFKGIILPKVDYKVVRASDTGVSGAEKRRIGPTKDPNSGLVVDPLDEDPGWHYIVVRDPQGQPVEIEVPDKDEITARVSVRSLRTVTSASASIEVPRFEPFGGLQP